MKSRAYGNLVVAALAALSMVAVGQQSIRISSHGRVEDMSKIKPRSAINAQDKKFIAQASASNAWEIRSSEIALRNSQNEWVRNFARDMIREHTLAQEELKQVARKMGANVPDTMPRDMERKLDMLRSKRGAEFDRAYRQEQMKAHQMTAQLMERQIKRGNNADIRNFAVKMLPGVKMHAEMIRKRDTMMDH